VRARTVRWPDHSRLFAVGDLGGWSVDEDAEHVAAAARRLGYRAGPPDWARFASRQSVFLTSHFDALHPRWLDSSHRIGTAYLHGRPGTPGVPEFDDCLETLRRRRDRIARIQVTHVEMHELVLAAGVEPHRVFRIPIGIDLEHFPLGDAGRRAEARKALGLPATAFVVGSFQKDGVGFGEGLEPKLVKGPDTLVSALERLRVDVPELHVLLTGPARGYVRCELERLGIPYRHVLARTRAELGRAYHALDLYLVPSRQEGSGGPRSGWRRVSRSSRPGRPGAGAGGRRTQRAHRRRRGFGALAAQAVHRMRTLRSLAVPEQGVRPPRGTSSSVWTTSGRCSSKGS
jgi:glycosyltransferase involved in cell wall biosynthesis